MSALVITRHIVPAFPLFYLRQTFFARHFFSITHWRGCWCLRAKSITCVTLVLVMTAVPGAPGPRRLLLLLSSSARRGGNNVPVALARIAVRPARVALARVDFWRMVTLGVRAWQLLGAGRRCRLTHHKDAVAPLPV